MNLTEFVDLVLSAKSISMQLAINTIRVDGIVYDLNDAVLESSHNDFNIAAVSDIKKYKYSLSGAVDKKSKLPMNSRLHIKFFDSTGNDKALTIEFNDQAKFTKNVNLTEQYGNLANHVSGLVSFKNDQITVTDMHVITINGEKLGVEEYHDKYKIFESNSKRNKATTSAG